MGRRGWGGEGGLWEWRIHSGWFVGKGLSGVLEGVLWRLMIGGLWKKMIV